MKNPVADKKKSSLRMNHGGNWNSGTRYARVSHRNYVSPSYPYSVIGFRLVRNKGKKNEKSSR